LCDPAATSTYSSVLIIYVNGLAGSVVVDTWHPHSATGGLVPSTMMQLAYAHSACRVPSRSSSKLSIHE
jgi:hypothetical protein